MTDNDETYLPAYGGPEDGGTIQVLEGLSMVIVPARRGRYSMYERVIDHYEFRRMVDSAEITIVKTAEEWREEA